VEIAVKWTKGDVFGSRCSVISIRRRTFG